MSRQGPLIEYRESDFARRIASSGRGLAYSVPKYGQRGVATVTEPACDTPALFRGDRHAERQNGRLGSARLVLGATGRQSGQDP